MIPPKNNEQWTSLLRERAEHIKGVRVVAEAAQIDVVVRGLDELASLYGDDAPGRSRSAPTAPPKRELITCLRQKSQSFLHQAGSARDASLVSQLRSLSAIFGDEATHFQHVA